MTPYELRFTIYQEARRILEMEYQYKHEVLLNQLAKLESWEKNLKFPDYPTQNQIEELARKIYSFVESK
jgi:hypothetical protein